MKKNIKNKKISVFLIVIALALGVSGILTACGDSKLDVNGPDYVYDVTETEDEYEFKGNINSTVIPDAGINIDGVFDETFYGSQNWFVGNKQMETESGILKVVTYFAETGFVISARIEDSRRAYHSNTLSSGHLSSFNCYFAFGDAQVQSDGVYEIECTAGNRFKISKFASGGLQVLTTEVDVTPLTAVKREGNIKEGTCYNYDLEMFLPYALFGKENVPDSVYLNPTMISTTLDDTGAVLNNSRTWYNFGVEQNTLYAWGAVNQGFSFDENGFVSNSLKITCNGSGSVDEEWGYDYVITEDVVKLYITAEEGYRLNKFKVNGVDLIGEIDTDSFGVSSFTFTAAGETVIVADFVELVYADVQLKLELYDLANNKITDITELATAYSHLDGNIDMLLAGGGAISAITSLPVDTDGKVAAGNIPVGTYTVSAYGYRNASVIINENDGLFTVSLYKQYAAIYGTAEVASDGNTVSITGNGNYTQTNWTGSAEIILGIETRESDGLVFKANLKMTNTSDGWTSHSTKQRYAIQLTESGKGFYLWSWYDKVSKTYVREFSSVTNAMSEGTAINGKEAENGWIYDAITGNDGGDIMVVRAGTLLSLYIKKDNVYTLVGTTLCDKDDVTKLVLYGYTSDYEYSNVTTSALEFVEQKDPTSTQEGNLAYYTNGTDYFLPNGTITTAEDVILREEVDVTLNVKMIALDGTTEVTLENGTQITLTGGYKTYTYTVGDVLDKMYAGEYVATFAGHEPFEFTVTNGAAITITLVRKIKIVGAPIVDNAWSGSEVIDTTDVTGNDIVIDGTLKMTNVSVGWNDHAIWQRFAIRVTESGKGFYFWAWKDNAGSKVHVRELISLTQATAEGTSVNKNEEANGWIYDAFTSENGAKFRIARTGTVITLYFFNGTEYLNMGSIVCEDTDGIELAVYGATATYEYSSVSIDELTYVAEVLPVGATNGNVAYYTDGVNYYLPNGTITTAEDVMLREEVDVTLNVKVIALDGTTEVTLENGTQITLTGGYKTYTYTVGDVLDKMYAGEYVATFAGHEPFEFTVTNGAAITITLVRKIKIVGAPIVDNAWSGSEVIDTTDVTGNDIVIDGTLKMTNVSVGWNDHAIWQRFAIRVTESGKGFYFWAWKDNAGSKVHVRELISLTMANAEGTSVNGNEKANGWIYDAFTSENGAKFKIVRTGTAITLYILNGAVYENMGSIVCEDTDGIELAIYGATATYEYSSVSIDELTYVAEVLPVGATNGNVAYYTDGVNYYLPNGTITTAEDVILRE